MPWKEILRLEARARFVLAVKTAQDRFAWLCRHFGISRKTAYKWWQRYRAAGIKSLEDQSRRPQRWPGAYALFWKERLRRARQRYPSWGPKKLQRWLRKQYPHTRLVPAISTLGRWLRVLKLIGPRPRRARRGPCLDRAALTVPQAPNEVWTVDFKGWFRTGDGTRVEPLTVRDLYTHFTPSQNEEPPDFIGLQPRF